jgi:hypothetical protein
MLKRCLPLVLMGMSLSLFSVNAQSVFYVNAAATGSANGSDWNNAFRSLPGSLQRGATYYVADGTYNGYVFDDPTSGTTRIIVKKATGADHGTSVGWQNSFGDGQAVFGKLSFNTSYYTVDGQVGHGADWWHTFTPYGFKIDISGGDNGTQLNAPCDGLTLKFIEMDGNGSGGTSFDGVRYNEGGDNITFSHIWIHHFDRCAFKIGSTTSASVEWNNWLFEYIFASDYSRNRSIHSEFMSGRGSGKCVFRFSAIKDFASTGGIILGYGDGWEIYGNVFFWSSFLGSTANNGAIGTWSSADGYAVRNFKIYNNTFWNLGANAKRIFPIVNSSSGHVVTNNLWVSCDGASSVFGAGAGAHNYNAFFDHGSTESESQSQVMTSNPLQDPANGDFRLRFATAPGAPVPFGLDGLALVRGADGNWDRGAFEFGIAGPDTNAPTILNIQAEDITPTSVGIVWVTDELATSIVQYGLTTSYSNAVTNSARVINHSMALTGLSPETLYHYRVRSVDAAGNMRTSGDMTFTTAVPDTTPPQITALQVQDIGASLATIGWTTDEPSSSVVEIGTTTSYGTAINSPNPVTTHRINVTGLSATTLYHYRVRSTDASGNTSTSGDLTFTTATPDLTPPTVALSAPLSGAIVSNAVTLTAMATDNLGGSGVANVSFFVDGVSVGTDLSSPYSAGWETRVFSNGVHSITAVAIDREGNRSESPAVIVTVENAEGVGLSGGLIVYLPLDGRMADEAAGLVARDASGNDNHGILFNGVTRSTGKLVGSLTFDGVNDYARVAPSARLETTIDAVTVSAWVKLERNGQWQAICRKVLEEGTHVSPFSAYDLMIQDSGGTVRARMAVSRPDGVRGTAYSSTSLSYGIWYHLTGVYDGSRISIYVNGSLEDSTAFSGEIVPTAEPLLIGRNGIGGDILKGAVDDFRVYDRALSASEVQGLFRLQAPSAPTLIQALAQ